VLKAQRKTVKEESLKEHFQGNSQSISYFQGVVKDSSDCSTEAKLTPVAVTSSEFSFSSNSSSEQRTDRKATEQSGDKKESPLEIEQILMQHDNRAANARLFNDCHVVIVEESSSAI